MILAPGAHDRPVAFPGWTLPGVITAGGAQTLVKTQCVLPGKRVVFAGSGPLALAFPAQLVGYGVERDGRARGRPGARAARPSSACSAPREGTPTFFAPRPATARALARPRAAALSPDRRARRRRRAGRAGRPRGRRRRLAPVVGTEETVAADTLCLGYGFFPSTELLRLAGCAFSYDEDLGGPTVVRDEWLRTSVFGLGGRRRRRRRRLARRDGRRTPRSARGAARAGRDRAGRRGGAAPILRRLRRREAFRRALRPLHAVGAGIYELATPETIVCRCEG